MLTKLIVFLSIIFIVVFIYAFFYFKDGYYRDLISIFISLLGTMIGSVVTMYGISYTIDKNAEERYKSELDEIKRLATIVYREIYENYKSVELYTHGMIALKLYDYDKEDTIFEEHTKNMLFSQRFYIMIPELREKFYYISMKINTPNEVIDNFVKFYNSYERLKYLYLNESYKRSKELTYMMLEEYLSYELIALRNKIFSELDYENRKYTNFEIKKEELEKMWCDFEKDKSMSHSLKEILIYLKNI